MKLKDIFSLPGAEKIRSLSELDQFFLQNQQVIEEACRPADRINGVPVRVSATVVVCRKNNDIHAYRRTDNYVWMGDADRGGPRRGIVGYWDTPKGVASFVGRGKWLVNEALVTGEIIGVGIATEYRPFPEINERKPFNSLPAEFVIMGLLPNTPLTH